MNCKPGDLAILIAAKHPENIGKIVEVEVFFGELAGHHDFWCVKGSAPYIFARDAWLRPVSGLLDTETAEDHQPIKELA